MIKNIIFDIGNVLIHFQPKQYLATFIPDHEVREKVYGAIFGAKEWLMLDRGVITEEEAFVLFRANCPEVTGEINYTVETFYEKMLTPISETAEYLKHLKQSGYRIYLLSNYQKKAFHHIKQRNDFFRFIDGGVISFEDRLMKPEPEIYQLLLNRYGLEPSETVFIDDTPENITAAEKLGIRGIVFRDFAGFKKEMEMLLDK